MDLHHRGPHAHTGYQRFETAFQFAGEMADIRRGTTHVEADDFVKPGHLCGFNHADHTTRRAGQNGVLALKQTGIGQATIGLHELQANITQLAGHLIDIAPQDWAEIGIHHGGITAPHQLHQRADFMADGDLSEADIPCDLCGGGFMIGVAITMHEQNGDGANAAVIDRLQIRFQGIGVERCQHFAISGDPFGHFDNGFKQHFRQLDVAVKQPGPVLITNTQCIAETTGHDQCGAVALAFQQGVGGNGGAHFHRINGL